MELIDGKRVSAEIRKEIAEQVAEMVARGEKRPHLVAILVGHDGGSETYVANKVKACEECGFKSTLLRFEDDITEAQLLAEVDKLNADSDVDGFIVQLPLPKHISEQKITEAIDPKKDVDGFHPQNVGRMAIGLPAFVSATPQGIVDLITRYNIPTQGKHAVIIGRSNIVGRINSLFHGFRNENVTVILKRFLNNSLSRKLLCEVINPNGNLFGKFLARRNENRGSQLVMLGLA